ncbi:DsbA family protein [Mesorhizobium sp. AR10]|uniref:DsbA family protein n=1 Tax=Mesorhizobium sp. AR10 TaxID=2865839 RepID=UPI00215E2239|nr:DsbA family protein [Mesorhizobium sp. AR10]
MFLDYNCPHCRTADLIIQQALKDDPNLKVVYKEYPGKGPGSKFAQWRRSPPASRENMSRSITPLWLLAVGSANSPS